MFCNACGTEFQGRYCHQCGRANPGTTFVPRRGPLERPRQGRKVAGVCLALANELNTDPILIRILWVVFTVFSGFVFGCLAYLVAWILIPEAPRLMLPQPADPQAT